MQIRLGDGTQLSGSLSGITATTAKGAITLRNRTKPNNTQSTRRSLILQRTSYLNHLWQTGVTATQKTGWDRVGAQEHTTGPLAKTRTYTGREQFLRVNHIRLGSGFQPRTDPGSPTQFSPLILPSPPEIQLSATNGWTFAPITPTVPNVFYQLRLSPALSAGQGSYKGKYAAYSLGIATSNNFINRPMNAPAPRYGPIQAGEYRKCILTLLRGVNLDHIYDNLVLVQA